VAHAARGYELRRCGRSNVEWAGGELASLVPAENTLRQIGSSQSGEGVDDVAIGLDRQRVGGARG
jgi:hypothetical protein